VLWWGCAVLQEVTLLCRIAAGTAVDTAATTATAAPPPLLILGDATLANGARSLQLQPRVNTPLVKLMPMRENSRTEINLLITSHQKVHKLSIAICHHVADL